MMVRGYYRRLFPIVSGYSIPLDWLRNLLLIKIVDSSAQLTVTRWKLISSHPASHSLHRSRILRECRPESDEHGRDIFRCLDLGNRFRVSVPNRKRLYHWTRETIYLAFARNAAAANIAANESGWPRERAQGPPMFISWAVTSYQSNGAECDFSQGISVCLIEIPYPIRPAAAPLLPLASPRNSHATRFL